MPNEREACLIAAQPDLTQAIARLRNLVPLLVIKRGSKGASAYTQNEEWHAHGRTRSDRRRGRRWR